jgi:hypothetical protein
MLGKCSTIELDSQPQKDELCKINSYLNVSFPFLTVGLLVRRPGHIGVHHRIPVKWGSCVVGLQFPATGQLQWTAACAAAPTAPTPTHLPVALSHRKLFSFPLTYRQTSQQFWEESMEHWSIDLESLLSVFSPKGESGRATKAMSGPVT